MNWVLQHVEEAPSEEAAYEYLEGLALQDGYLGGRVLPKGSGKPWRAQAFFEDEPNADWLPEGTRRVLMPKGLARSLGVRAGRRENPGSDKVEPRIRFNWGYHDGANDVKNSLINDVRNQRIRDVSRHHDPIYAQGYDYGVDDARDEVYEDSTAAWKSRVPLRGRASWMPTRKRA